MTLEELQKMAHELAVPDDYGHSQVSLVRAIQRQRGETDCFGNDNRFRCNDMECQWRRDCLKPIAIWLR